METPFRFPQPEHDHHDEELEVAPWDSLVRPTQSSTGKWVVLAAVGFTVLAVAISAARAFWPPVQSLPDPAVTQPADALEPTFEPGLVSVPQPIPSPIDQSSAATIVTGADLLAIDPGEVDRAAAEMAEFAVVEFFTRDGQGGIHDPWADVAVGGTGVRSYVDSAHAIQVERTSPDRRRVTVVVRLLVAVDDGGYRRQDPRAVQVDTVLGDQGVMVVDLPRPVDSTAAVVSPEPLVSVDHPDLVRVARELAAPFGSPAAEAYHVGATDDGRIRVGLLLSDEEGVEWPVAFWFDRDGTPLS